MDDKRGTKRECSPSAGGKSFARRRRNSTTGIIWISANTGSLSIVSSRHLCSLVFELGNTSGKIPMLNPPSFIVDTSRDEELARKLFGNQNRDILGPPGDGKIIVLDDSNDNGEAQEEKTADIESMAAPTSVDDAPAEARISNSDDQGPVQEVNGGNNSGRRAGEP
jgi:hypothetical protein